VSTARPRSAAFSAVCAVAIVVGSLGLLGSLWELAGIIFQNRLSSAFMPHMAAPGFVKMQHDLQKAILDASLPVARGAFNVARLVVEALVVFGAVRTLQLHAAARRMFLVVLVVAACTEFAGMALALLVQIRAYSAFQPILDRWMDVAAGGAPAKVRSVFQTAMSASVVVGIAWAIAWGLIKIVFFVFARVYLARPGAAALFEAPAPTTDSALPNQ
jgi:hypothetical protein